MPPKILIYSKNRDICYEDTLTIDIDNLLEGKSKGYFESEINQEKKLVIGKKIKNKKW